VTFGSVDQELLLRNEYLVTENRILRHQLKGRLRLSDGERKALAEIGQKLGKKALEAVVNIRPLAKVIWVASTQKLGVSRPMRIKDGLRGGRLNGAAKRKGCPVAVLIRLLVYNLHNGGRCSLVRRLIDPRVLSSTGGSQCISRREWVSRLVGPRPDRRASRCAAANSRWVVHPRTRGLRRK
jgi:hypothetical protein